MYEFEYQKPGSLSEAASALKSADDGSLLAGGQTLLPTMKQRLASPSDLVDLAGVPDMSGISVDGGNIVVGAMTTHAAVAGSADVQSNIPGLAKLAGCIGDPQVRHRGTIGGSIANNDPAADYPGACLGLGATIVTDSREISADDFFVGLFETALNDGEIITAVRFPIPETSDYAKFPQPASRFSLVGAFVARTSSGARVAITGAGQEGVFRVPEMEAALNSNFAAGAVASISVPSDDLNSDIHGSAEYRAHLVTVMAKRAVDGCG
ncbi:MAG: xanthine dehydrogenase family protein subunit M [Rhodospirillaceae bacterium]|jgi:aerobic carbon-monoxide dehydrogenase medium subunit|nr:xanthine dehydrogenase family protein subunit M [Rhodospirillaceae bacterium]MBT5666048.1 xanthine dehydrogenase family protein subunit M [Rhodospirillaceae bacterium]MBT5810814.1 xanthine dehydrogenase family protein subunit M [Rhodospirillaceae bacterium]